MSGSATSDASGSAPRPELRATYRLQLSTGFGFRSARGLIPYLRDLGISHLYLSPSLQARAHSTHGYDVVDPTRLSDALGGEGAFRELAVEARANGLGIVLDVVPNHMATDEANRYWADPELRARFFDIDPISGRHRRFFDIDGLAGIRVEHEEVFAATHSLILRLLDEGLVDGLRIDHPDGLADPAGYLQRLRTAGAARIWVEKILSPTERLPGDWPVSGTVGYDFLNDVCGLFVDPAGESALTELWHEVSGDARPFDAYAYEAKLEQASTTFRPELERLARTATATANPEALALALSLLPVYRTYAPPTVGEFLTRLQQTSPAIMAKGVEDTAFYRYCRLLALNDVGGDPGRFGVGVESFHATAAERAARYPQALLTTMTHDAKRSTDVRARIAALAQIPETWAAFARRWLERSERHCTKIAGSAAPDLRDRYFLLQTLIGVVPITPERLDSYVEKALREAKRNTNWIQPDMDYERAATKYARELIADPSFMAELDPLLVDVGRRGALATLGQLTLKLTSPGVPDTYQGDEFEFRALVDPDNRRPVDWDLRRERLLYLLGGGRPGDDLNDRKLWLTARLLGLRVRLADVFASGGYEPLDAGRGACAFMRADRLLTVVALPVAGEDGTPVIHGLPGGRWREVLTGDEHSFDARTRVGRLVAADTGVGVYERI